MSLFSNESYGEDHPASNSAPNRPSPSHTPPSFEGDASEYLDNIDPSLSSDAPATQGCYWALLSTDLQFIYVDPIFQTLLEEQASHVIGKSLLQFIHPEEQSTAQRDLGNTLSNKTLHGTITRVRFARLSRIRRELGHAASQSYHSSDQFQDHEYNGANIVINWAAEGLILCFIHAIIDISLDEHVKSSCGTPVMPQEQLQRLSRSLLMCAPESSHGRVFQILANTSARLSLLSWPPPQDGTSSDTDLAELAKFVDLDQGSSPTAPAKTTCTRRFKAFRELHGTEVESVYIPHGSVIFACHKLYTSPCSSPSSAVHPQSAPSSNTTSTRIPDSSVAFMGYNSSTSSTSYSLPPPPLHQTSFYDQQYSLPSISSTLPPPTGSYSFTAQPTLSHNNYSYAHWANPPSHPSMQSLRSGHWNHGSTGYENGSSLPPTLPLSGGHSSHRSYARALSPYGSYSSASSNAANHLDSLNGETPSPTSATSSNTDLVPPPRRRVSPASSRDYRESNGASGGRERSHNNRPSGLLKCSSCKTTTSPEWRKGPSGKKELCNACGLRYARSRAKKEGHVVANSGRKRKEKAAKRESCTPPSATSTAGSVTSSYSSSATLPYNSSSSTSHLHNGSLRRVYTPSYEDASYSSSGANDLYGAPKSAGTPSPSPPAGAASAATGFPHYVSAPVDHGHQSTSRNYYGSSISSPLAANLPMLQSQSFERDHRDREGMSPTPVSAEPRASYYQASYDRVDRKDTRGYEEYEREAQGRARSLVTG